MRKGATLSSVGMDRVVLSGVDRRAFRKAPLVRDQGIREWDPKPKPQGVIVLTERTSPNIRSTVGWPYPLEHYDEKLKLDPLSQYAELLLIVGSNGEPDRDTVQDILAEARDRLADPEYARLQGYADLLTVGIPPGPLPPR